MTDGLTLRPRRQFVLWVLAIYAMARVVTTTILLLVMRQQAPSGMTGGDDVPVGYFAFTALWDGQWYQLIAEDGYPSTLPVTDSGKVGENPWAFYPLFPYLARTVMAVTGLGFPAVASTIALLCGVAAAVIMGLLLRDRIGDPAAYLVVALWASFPASVTLQLAYTESLAMLLLVGYLYALSRERWLVATVVALLVGLSRPIAVPLGVVTLVVLVHPVAAARRAPDRRPGVCRDGRLARGLRRRRPALARHRLVAHRHQHGLHRHDGGLARLRDGRAVHAVARQGALLPRRHVGPDLARRDPHRPRRDGGRALGAEPRRRPAHVVAGLPRLPRQRCSTRSRASSATSLPLFPLLVVVLGAGWADRRGNGWGRLLWRAVPLLVVFVVCQYWWTDELWRFVPPSDYPP